MDTRRGCYVVARCNGWSISFSQHKHGASSCWPGDDWRSFNSVETTDRPVPRAGKCQLITMGLEFYKCDPVLVHAELIRHLLCAELGYHWTHHCLRGAFGRCSSILLLAMDRQALGPKRGSPVLLLTTTWEVVQTQPLELLKLLSAIGGQAAN